MIISLTGFMGCGKSSVGRELSKLLGCCFVDLDEVIVEREGRSIPEIFAEDGETEFRRLEKETLKDILETGGRVLEIPKTPAIPTVGHPLAGGGMSSPSSSTPACKNQEHPSNERPQMILALGGGAVMTQECERMVHEQTVCVYLRTSVDELVGRLSGETSGRPLLNTNATEYHFNQAERVEKSAMQERIASLLTQRSATYEKTAHIIIDTDCKTIDKIAEEIFYKTGNISTDRPRNG